MAMTYAPIDKVLATVVSLHGTHAFAIDQHGVNYFIFHRAVERTSSFTLDDFKVGTHVWGRPILHPKGMRLIEVQVKEI